MCVCYGFRIGDWFGEEVIQKYWEMCRLGVLNDCSRMFFFFFFLERKHVLEMDGET